MRGPSARRDPHDDVVLLLCIAAGAIVGFSVVGSAALGTAAGIALGLLVVAALDARAAHPRS